MRVINMLYKTIIRTIIRTIIKIIIKTITMENIRKKLNIRVVTLLSITILLALFAFFTSYVALGVVLLLVACALPFFGMKKEVYTLTGSPVKHLTFYFESEKLSTVEHAVKASFRNEEPKVPFISYGNGRMEVTMSKDKKFAVVRLSRYSPHKYEPVGKEAIFLDDQVTSLCSYLNM